MLAEAEIKLDFPRKRALQLIEQGLKSASAGEMKVAYELFVKSIALHPTAEGYTFAAWMLSFEQRFQESIDLCKIAISLDPEFGNPYNDIGSYSVSMGDFDEAEKWFLKATHASRYQPRHFPHMNLARIYMHKGKYSDAEFQLRKALTFAPGDSTIHSMLVRVKHALLSV